MANFVLVHGAFSGAWIWGPLVERLRAAGYGVEDLRVVRPDLEAVFLHLTGRELRE